MDDLEQDGMSFEDAFAQQGDEAGSGQEPGQSVDTDGQPTERAAGETATDQDEGAAGSGTPESIPYGVFKERNELLRQREGELEELQQLLLNPSRYREVFRERHGIDPFAAVPGSQGADKQAPQGLQPLPELSPDDFADPDSYRVYEVARHDRELLIQTQDRLNRIESRSQASEVEQAVSVFNSTVKTAGPDIIGREFQPDEIKAIRESAASTFGHLPVDKAAEMAIKVLFFDEARNIGRTEAGKIIDKKKGLAATQTTGTKGSARPVDREGMSFEEAWKLANSGGQ